ncbi:MAG: DUF58 domain-containing protein [Planctomycetes bacterium]|nr:DUF58 domain-containing protein [Planctomycetota bacterium]
MIPKEILRKVQRIQITTRHMVTDVFAGEYESVFKGRGMEFDEVREYQPGDEIRTIDWNVTARMGHPYVKRFVEERELTVMLVVDASSSGKFGTVKQLKNELAAEICAVLAFAAIKNNDKVGLIIFTDRIEKFVPPKKGTTHVLRVIRELLYFQPQHRETNIAVALEYLSKVTTRRTVTFLVSDFMSAGYEKPLRIANKRHDIIAITITDPRELELPKIGFVELQDAETGEILLIDTTDANTRKAFNVLNTKQLRDREELFRSMEVDAIDVRTDRPYVEPIMHFFRMRERRLAT